MENSYTAFIYKKTASVVHNCLKILLIENKHIPVTSSCIPEGASKNFTITKALYKFGC